jgi:hypothetical protein
MFVSFLLTVLLTAPALGEDDKEVKRGGTIVGVVVKKDKNSLEVKADGEEKPRRYVPRWVGGLPKDGGGFDKKTLELIAKVKLGSRVKLQWEFEERPRLLKLDVLKEPAENKDN